MTISLSGDVGERLSGGMNVGSAIELPYFVPKFWALNGDARLAALGGAQYFGGWAVSAEDWTKACNEEWMAQAFLERLPRTEIVAADNHTVPAFTTRSLLVAPICNRITWMTQDGGRFSQYAQGLRQHVQAIVYLAMKADDGQLEPLGPVMLTAKGYQAKNMLDAFAAWDRATRMVRGKIAPGIPAWCFYLSIGTFGDKRNSIMVGKAGRQSAITPISTWVPKEITPELVERVFVGQDVAEAMVNYLESSQEWLHAYDNKRGEAEQVGAVQQVDGGEFPLDPVPPGGGQDYPF